MNLEPATQGELFFRLGLALALGFLVGIERELKKKAAGLRTNMLVSLGSAIFVLIPIQLGIANQNPDTLARVISAIVGGVSFIGAGAIIRESKVRGLTSAATVWLSSAVGVAVGCGLWLVSILGMLFTWIILYIFSRLESTIL